MPTYRYECCNKGCVCDTFETYQSIKAEPLKICPYCNETSIQRTFHAVEVMVNSEPKTLGALADKNRKKLGNAYCEDQQRKTREERLTANEFVGTLPKGGSIRKREAKDTPWRKADEPVDLSLTRMSEKQTHQYIMTGQKPNV